MNNNTENPHEYNGFTNRATWVVCVWTDNDQDNYDDKRNKLRLLDRPVTAADAQAIYEGVMLGPTSDHCYGHPSSRGCNQCENGEYCPSRFDQVDWADIAENWEIERQEMMEYES